MPPPPPVYRVQPKLSDAVRLPAPVRGVPDRPAPRPQSEQPEPILLQGGDGRTLLSGPPPRAAGDAPPMVNMSGAVEADSIAIIDGEPVFSGLDMGAWSEMLTSLTESYADPEPAANPSTDGIVEIVSSRAEAEPPPASAHVPMVARIANRDFSAGVSGGWIMVGKASLASTKSLNIGGKSFRSPAKGGGTFLTASPAEPGSPAGVAQQIAVVDGDQINFQVLFASPGRETGDEVSIDLVRDGIELPLYMANGLLSPALSWQAVSYTVPQGGGGTYLLRLSMNTAKGRPAQVPVVGFLIEREARLTEFGLVRPAGLH